MFVRDRKMSEKGKLGIYRVTSGTANEVTLGGAYREKDLREMTYEQVRECLETQLQAIKKKMDLENIDRIGLTMSQECNLKSQWVNLKSQLFILQEKESLSDIQIRRIAKKNAELVYLQNSYPQSNGKKDNMR